MVMGISADSELLGNLRSAVAAEFTTLPTYLYPYWSIKPASDGGGQAAQDARAQIKAVFLEEMLHMALSSNLLNALGGTPCLTESPYLPTFPGRLLRSVTKPQGWGTHVDLLPMGHESIAMLLRIELPEGDDPGGPTLGEFYRDYVEAGLPEDEACYAGGRQLAAWDNPGAGRLFAITSKAEAMAAMTEVIDQGEGLSLEKHDDGYHELAHYWRFRTIQDSLTAGSFNVATDVYPVISSPTTHVDSYTDDQRAANERFNRTYSTMIKAIQATLMTETPDVYPIATGLMAQLQQQAAVLRQLGNVPGTQFLAGPSFEYVGS